MVIVASLLSVAMILGACGGSPQPTSQTSTSTGSTQKAGHVEVDYFYASDACFCLALATDWINEIISSEYKTQLDGGTLIYHSYDTKDPANEKIKADFNATDCVLFLTTIIGQEEKTWPVSKIWMYTDSTGTNQDLKLKFTNELKSNINQALSNVG